MAHIVTFYSFKGGAGRSVLLANVAYVLAMRGKKVVCIDFDLEAGGLHTIFGIDTESVKESILDILTGELRVFENAVIPIRLPRSVSGKIWLLPAVSNYEKLDRIGMSPQDLAGPLERLIRGVEERYVPHFVLIDARAGFAELSRPAMDAARFSGGSLILVSRLNRQNFEGLRVFLDVIENVPPRTQHCIALSQVPVDLDRTKSLIQSMNRIIGPTRSIDFIIPYDSRLALEEKVFGLDGRDETGVPGYAEVADWIEAQANAR